MQRPVRPGIQTEILVSLGLVMLLATLVLAAVLAAQHEAQLRRVLGRALVAEALGGRPLGGGVVPGTEWWVRDRSGGVRPRGPVREALDREVEALAREVARRGAPLLRPGAPWERVRFAAPLPGGGVAVARLPQEASWRMRMAPLLVLGLVLLVEALVVTALGGALLGRRVVQPLRRVAAAARAVAEGAEGTRVGEEGARETADLARSFNEMNEALEARREALRKAVVELRDANAELRTARAGLDRAERLAAVGQLAAGVAHEVGNPIGAMLAFLDLASRDPGAGEATRAHLARAAREGERVRRILRQLLDFSRPPRGEPTRLDLAAVAEEARGLVAAQ
ncbi:MAG: histidine kinase dimerization/phospho-acceptor domain-containing protein, partial [Myxococcota bacterium]|nr:histidine kinase dimerization/phospho-acceptor domain-containing protein [Myxococcota bacterium]